MTKSILSHEPSVRAAAESSMSIRQALEKLGLRSAGGNYKAFNSACIKFGIGSPKSTGSYQTRKAISLRTIPLSDILIENSNYSGRKQIKTRCFSAGLLLNKCYICGMGPEWNGSQITLQLDHINGVHNDHRLENLRILCPNCHSQTETFCGKNKLQQNNCDCGVKILNSSSKCKPCSNRLKSESQKRFEVSKETLELLINDHSFVDIGKMFGVSDNAIRKRAKKYGILP